MKKESLSASMAKLIMTVSLIVCIGALLGALGYFVTMPKSEVVINNEVEKEIMIQDETANLKTYRNEEYGFEVKYPNNFTFQMNNFIVCEETPVMGCLGFGRKENIPLFWAYFKNNDTNINLEILDNKNLFSLNDWYKNYSKSIISGGIPKEERTKIEIDGADGFMMNEGCCQSAQPTAYFSEDDKIYIIFVPTPMGDPKEIQKNILEPLLSSFKFIEKETN